MKKYIKNFLEMECNKLKERYFEYLYELDKTIKRRSSRIGRQVPKIIKKPPYWNIPQFNPFIVSSQLDLFSFTLAKKIKQKKYKPAKAIIRQIVKENGKIRELNVFQLPDAAISNLTYKSLLRKNYNRFSSYSYAYREDKNAHDAVVHMYSEWKNLERIFVAEFDFSNFFDNINHEYLWRVIDRHGFLYTEEEKYIINQFLESETAEIEKYTAKGNTRTIGIPQGSSISLFLANIACWEMDKDLERLGVGFARYADDTIIWSNSYDRIVDAYEVIKHYSQEMSVPINFSKSEGINLLTKHNSAEIKFKKSINFVGYKINLDTIAISDKSIKKIKAKISYIIYENLLKPLKENIYNPQRLSADIDYDYIVALYQIRRYLYGGLTDLKLRQYIKGITPNINFRGAMSYYPLVNDTEQLSKLDRWLIYTFKQALKLREKLWYINKNTILPGPRPNWVEEITLLKEYKRAEEFYDLRMPSFFLINKAMQVALERKGIQYVSNPQFIYY